MRKKNLKILTRITAGVLAVIMAATLILQLVSSVSAEGMPLTTPAQVSDDNDVTLGNLPLGFEYVEKGNRVEIQKSEDNKLPSIMITSIPTFDTGVVSVFVGNLETKEVTRVDLYGAKSYAEALNIPHGYYVLYGNDIAWSDANNQSYEVMNGDGLYFYYGDNGSFDPNKYPTIDWNTNMDEIMYLSLQESTYATEVVPYNGQLTVTDAMNSIPSTLVPVAQTTDNQQQSTPTTTTQQSNEEKQNDNLTIGMAFKRLLKNSSLFIVLLIGLGVAYYVIRQKNKKNIQKQLENDSYDDSRLN